MEHIIPIDIGTIIVQKRLKLNLTQKEVSKGICSIPYLSKIENNKIDPNEDTIMLICKKLNIKLESKENHFSIKEDIKKWLISITEDQEKNIEYYAEKLKNMENYKNNSLIINYILVKTRYFLYKKLNEEAKKQLDGLEKFKKTFSLKQLMVFHHVYGLYEINNLNYKESIIHLTKANEIGEKENIKDIGLIYHLSLAHSHVFNPIRSLYYGEKALEIYKDSFNIKKSISCSILLGINFARIHQYEEAWRCYNQAYNLMLKDDDNQIGMLLHNMGYLRSLEGKSQSAIDYYHKSLENKSENDESYLITLYYLVNEYIKTNNLNETRVYLKKAFLILRKCKSNLYIIKFTILENKVKKETVEKQIDYIENTAIPYFSIKGENSDLIDYYENLAELCSQIHWHKKSSAYYKIAYQKTRDLLGGIF